MRLAGAKYQESFKGARKHAARQQRQCDAKLSAQKVTHHGFPTEAPSLMVATLATGASARADMEDRDGAVADDAAARARS